MSKLQDLMDKAETKAQHIRGAAMAEGHPMPAAPEEVDAFRAAFAEEIEKAAEYYEVPITRDFVGGFACAMLLLDQYSDSPLESIAGPPVRDLPFRIAGGALAEAAMGSVEYLRQQKGVEL